MQLISCRCEQDLLQEKLISTTNCQRNEITQASGLKTFFPHRFQPLNTFLLVFENLWEQRTVTNELQFTEELTGPIVSNFNMDWYFINLMAHTANYTARCQLWSMVIICTMLLFSVSFTLTDCKNECQKLSILGWYLGS